MEPPAPYSNTDTAEIEAINALRSLLDPGRVKADIRERDKFPNSDGYLELVDGQGRPCGKIEVQIKRIGSDRTSCPCPSRLVGYTAVTTLPVILVGVDPTSSRAYWTHVTQLMPGYKPGQHTFTVQFSDAFDYIDKTPSCPCYHRWLELAQEYQGRVQLKSADRVKPPLAQSLTNAKVEALQVFIDAINDLLDRDFTTVKAILFPGIWKFGVGCRLVNKDLVLYQLLGVPRGKAAPLIVELPDTVTPAHLGADAETTTVMSRDAFFGNPGRQGQELVFKMLGHLVQAKALPLNGAGMAADLVFGFIRRYHRWLEVKPDCDDYQLAELLIAFGSNLSRTTGAVATPLPVGLTGIRVVDLDMINQLKSIPTADQHKTPPVFVLSSNAFPLKASFQSISLLSSLGVSTLERSFRGPDRQYQAPPNNFIWSCYSREREIENAVRILESVVREYAIFIRGCAFPLESSPYLDAGTTIVFRYISSHDRPLGDGPTLYEYHLRNPQGLLPKTAMLSELTSTESEHALPGSRLNLGNESCEVHRTVSRSADFLFGETPLVHLIYQFLADDLKTKYALKGPL